MIFDKFLKKKKESAITAESYTDEMVSNIANQLAISIAHRPVNPEPIIPEYKGDYAKTVFLWSNSKPSCVKDDKEYKRYIIYECGIAHPSDYHKQMIAEGYFARDSFEESLLSLKGEELKRIAGTLDVSISGKKSDLAKRIANAPNVSDITQQIPITYSLSDKGKKFLSEHDDCVQVHRHQNFMIDWTAYSEEKDRTEDKSFYNVCSNILLRRIAADKKAYGRSEYISLAELSNEIGDRSLCIACLLRVLFIDISGVINLPAYLAYQNNNLNKEYIRENSNMYSALPWITDRLYKLRNYYHQGLLGEVLKWKLPVMIGGLDVFSEIVNSSINGSFDYQHYIEVLRDKHKKYVDEL